MKTNLMDVIPICLGLLGILALLVTIFAVVGEYSKLKDHALENGCAAYHSQTGELLFTSPSVGDDGGLAGEDK